MFFMRNSKVSEKPFLDGKLAELVFHKRGGKTHRIPMSVREAGQEADLPFTTISRIERGFEPTIDTFRKLCIWLEVSADDLLGIPPPKKRIE